MKLNLGKPEKFSLLYFSIQNTWFRVLFFFWYKSITVTGLKRVYRKNPIILAPNHQNTLMDALAIMGIQTRQIAWLARADIFKNKFAALFLRSIKIMPAFRQQDGIKNLENNELVFKKCVEILSRKRIITLFPETTHWGFRRLRPIKKAIPRIAFMAEETHDFSLDCEIIPVGIYFDHYTSIRKNLLVNFGEPIRVNDYKELYKENPTEALIELKKKIEAEMKKNMIHIGHTGELYDAYELLRFICEEHTEKFYNFFGRKFVKQFQTHKKIIETLDKALETKPQIIENLKQDTLQYGKQLQTYNFRDWVVQKQGGDAFQIIWNILKLIAGLPLFIIGFVTHFVPYHVIGKLSKKIAKDPQFRNTISFGLSLVTLPILYGIYIGIITLFTSLLWWQIIILFIAIMFSGVIAFEYAKVFRKTFHMIRFNIFLSLEKPHILELIQERKKIIKIFSTL